MKKRYLLMSSIITTLVVSLSGCYLFPSSSSSSSSSSFISSSLNSSTVSSSIISSSSSSSSSSSTEKLYANLVSTNDIHGRLVTADGEYGLDILSSKFNDLERKYGDFIKIANGDIFQGKFESNVMYGKPMIDCMNAMEFDAMVIGNHEFDWGIDKIAAYNDGDESNGEADFPFLSCNIAYKSNNQLLDWVEPYTILENNGNKIGLIGAIGSGLTSSINGGMIKDYVFLDVPTQVGKYAEEIRTKYDVDYVVLALHDHNENTLNEIGTFKNNKKINAIFTAHTHQRENMVVGGNIPVLQGGGNNKYVSVIRLKGDIYTKSIESINGYTSDSSIKSIIDSYVNGEIEAKGNEVLGYNNSYKSSAAMAELLATVMKEKFDADVGITNTARTSLDAGNILMKEMYEVFPFDNMIIKATISGRLLKSFVNYAYSMYYDDEFSLSNIQDSETYTIAIIDYVYDNERFTSYFNSNPEIRIEQNVYMRDLMIDYIKEVKNI